MGDKGLGNLLICHEVLRARPAAHKLLQDGIGFLVMDYEEVLGAMTGRGGEAV